MPKSRSTNPKSSKVGRTAASGKFVSSKSAKAGPRTTAVIESTSKRFSKALKELAKR